MITCTVITIYITQDYSLMIKNDFLITRGFPESGVLPNHPKSSILAPDFRMFYYKPTSYTPQKKQSMNIATGIVPV